MKKVPSIKLSIYTEPDYNYTAFVYRYINIINGKIYIGYHVGMVDDGYFHSSECPEFLSVFTGSTPCLEYEVLHYGTNKQMKTKEHIMLKSVKAKSNKQYYNRSNGSPAYYIPSLALAREWVKRIESGEFDKGKLPLERFDGIQSVQTRFQTDMKHMKDIRDRINDQGGNTDKCRSLVIFELNGEWWLIGGNHTLGACRLSKHAIEVGYSLVPETELNGLTKAEIELIGNLLNKQPDIVTKPVGLEDGIKYVVSRYEENDIEVEDDHNTEALLEMGFTKNRIKTVRQKSKDRIHQNKLKMNNLVWIDWTEDPYKTKLDDKLDLYSNSDTIAIDMTSGMFSWDKIIKPIWAGTTEYDSKTKTDIIVKPNVHIFVRHPNPDSQDYWQSTLQAEEKRKIKFFLKTLGYNVRIQELETTVPNGLELAEEDVASE